jgi:hypothetical protein
MPETIVFFSQPLAGNWPIPYLHTLEYTFWLCTKQGLNYYHRGYWLMVNSNRTFVTYFNIFTLLEYEINAWNHCFFFKSIWIKKKCTYVLYKLIPQVTDQSHIYIHSSTHFGYAQSKDWTITIEVIDWWSTVIVFKLAT